MTTNVVQTNGHAMAMPNGEKNKYGEKMLNGDTTSNGATFQEKTSIVDKTGQGQAESAYDSGKVI